MNAFLSHYIVTMRVGKYNGDSLSKIDFSQFKSFFQVLNNAIKILKWPNRRRGYSNVLMGSLTLSPLVCMAAEAKVLTKK